MRSTVRTGLLLLCFTGLTGCVVETAEEIGSNAQNGEGGEHDSGLSGEGGSGGGAGGPGASICQANNDCDANQVCVDGICTAPRPNTPSEICDQLDNDQDGTIDEGVCDPNVECQSSDDCPPDLRCVQGVCAEMLVAQNEACDGIDNDGDGTVDEQPVPTFCAVAIGECRAEGIIQCEQGVETCSAQPADPDPEECNALDDDCDGLVDEGVCGPDVECRSSDDCPPGLICVDNVCAQDPDNPCGADFDQDAIGEQCDNCPQTFNPDQTDTDGDGIGDACDDDPQPEICDGIDNDLDGVIDEGAQGEVELCGDQIDNDCDGIVDEYLNGRFSDFLGEDCSVGTGACFAQGQVVCNADRTNVICGAVAGEPAPHDQSCDGIDDDCDGVNDENYPEIAPIEDCGIGACVATAFFICVAGEPNSPCRIAEPAPDDATCDSIDDDCDGAIDEDFPVTNTSCGVGECVNNGVQRCNGGRVIDTCIPHQPAINDATCNSRDDDCDGVVDEDCQGRSPCQGDLDCRPSQLCVDGVCLDVQDGEDGLCNTPDDCDPDQQCVQGQCVILPGPDGELCDAVDDDGDGRVDEDYVSQITSCGIGRCLSQGRTLCTRGGQLIDTCVPRIPQANDSTCDGVDNDCDGVTDEDFMSEPTSCGLGQCAANGMTFCVNGQVQDSCLPGAPQGNDGTCNGLDDDCDGEVDEQLMCDEPPVQCQGAADCGPNEQCVQGICQ